MMPDYYDRQGRPMTLTQWARSRNHDRKVEQTTLPNGRWVSTVWLGLDHQFGDGPPLIFETMVFPTEGDYSALDCARYSTEAEARAGHARMVAKWSADDPEVA